MENLKGDKPLEDGGCEQGTLNKRKRRYSSTQLSDESSKKKIVSTRNENNEIALAPETLFITNSNENEPDEVQSKIVAVSSKSNDNVDNNEKKSKLLLVEFCDEVLYEIFKFLDTWSLRTTMTVCTRLHKFLLDKRLWKYIDLSQEPLPLGILEDILELSSDKTSSMKLRGPSPSQHIAGEIYQFNHTLRVSFTTRCTKLKILELYGVTLDFNHITINNFPQTLKRLVLNTCNVQVIDDKTLFTGIDTHLINLEELSIENNSWFDPYCVMPLSKLPLLRYLSLKGCCQMQEFIPYGSIAASHGFKHLEILDLRNTPLNDSDLQCFNAVETLKELYLECPDLVPSTQMATSSKYRSETVTNNNSSNTTNSLVLEKPTTSNKANIVKFNSVDTEIPTTSNCSSINKDKDDSKPKEGDEGLQTHSQENVSDSESISSLSSCSSSSSSSSLVSRSLADNDGASSTPRTINSRFGVSPNIVPPVGTNAAPRRRCVSRPDHIFYLDLRNRICRHNNIRNLHLPGQARQQNQNQQQSPPPVIEEMMRHNIFWDIVNPLGRVVGVGGPDRLFVEENGAEYHLIDLFSLSSSRRQSRGRISDRGVCCFGRARNPVQQGVVWLRFNNRPNENRFERFSVRHYKFVTDVSLEHLVQCSPHLKFLDVSGTSVTLEGVQRFKNLKPECEIVAEHLLGVAKI